MHHLYTDHKGGHISAAFRYMSNPGYLILFATHAFVPQRQLLPRDPPSPPVFLLISAHFTATPGIPVSPAVLKSARIACKPAVELLLAGASSAGTVTCASSLLKEVYNPKAVIPHAASLHQAFAHCAIFPTAASRRSLGRVSVPVWPVTLSGRLPVVALVGHYPTNKRSYPVLDPVSQAYPEVQGRSPTCYSPVRRSCTPKGLTARLACVKHAASVRPEPGSNSPLKTLDFAGKPTNQS
eukprot:gene19708-23602_t